MGRKSKMLTLEEIKGKFSIIIENLNLCAPCAGRGGLNKLDKLLEHHYPPTESMRSELNRLVRLFAGEKEYTERKVLANNLLLKYPTIFNEKE
jgi:hypothetical protein